MTSDARFVEPDIHRPFDVQRAYEECPPDATVRGMYVNDILGSLKSAGKPLPDTGPVSDFKDYPYRLLIQTLGFAAEQMYPDDAPLYAMRKLSRGFFPTLRKSLIGKVVFGALGNNLTRIMSVSTKRPTIALSHTITELVDLTDNSFRVRIAPVFLPVDGPYIGVIEGAVTAFNHTLVSSRVHLESDRAGSVEVRWR